MFDPRRPLAQRVYYGWVIATACFLLAMAAFGTSYAFGVFYDAFIAEFDVSRAVLAAVFGLQTAIIYVVAVPAGQYVDRYGQRRIAALSTVLFTAGLVWSALARSYLELLVAFGVVAATGMAGLYVVSYATIPLWFGHRRGAAAGFAASGLGLGIVVVPPGADWLISLFGWRAAMLVVAGSVATLCLLAVALFADRPEDVGADSAGEFDSASAGEREPGSDADDDVATADRRSIDGPGLTRPSVVSLPFLFVFLSWLFVSASVYVLLSHVVLHATDVGFGRSVGVLAVTVIGVATTVARLGVGVLSDRVGRTRTFAACAVLMGVAMLSLAAAPAVAVFMAAIVVFGVGYGGCGGLFGAQVADLFGRRTINTTLALMSLSFGLSGILAPPLAGLVFEQFGGYELAFVVLGVSNVAGAGCVVLAARYS